MPDLIVLAKKPWPAVYGDAAGRSREDCSSFEQQAFLRASIRTAGLLTKGGGAFPDIEKQNRRLLLTTAKQFI
jgi:hypothetical protein